MTKFVKNHITKPIKKFIVKPIVSVYHKATRKINKVKNSIHRFFTRPKPSPRKIIRRVLPSVRRVVKKVYHRIVPKPVRRVVHRVRTVYKNMFVQYLEILSDRELDNIEGESHDFKKKKVYTYNYRHISSFINFNIILLIKSQ